MLALNTLYRPGLMDSIPDYQKGDSGNCPKYGIPELDKILEDTNGILFYQEHYIRFFVDFLGKTPGAAFSEYQALARNRVKQILEYKKEFMSEGDRRHLSEHDVERVWNLLVKQSQYAFQKAHAVCYTTIGYQCAFLKAHYPRIFLNQYNSYVYEDQ